MLQTNKNIKRDRVDPLDGYLLCLLCDVIATEQIKVIPLSKLAPEKAVTVEHRG